MLRSKEVGAGEGEGGTLVKQHVSQWGGTLDAGGVASNAAATASDAAMVSDAPLLFTSESRLVPAGN